MVVGRDEVAFQMEVDMFGEVIDGVSSFKHLGVISVRIDYHKSNKTKVNERLKTCGATKTCIFPVLQIWVWRGNCMIE